MARARKDALTVVQGGAEVAAALPAPSILGIPLDQLANVPVAQMAELFALHQKMEADKARRDFAVAFGKCQQEMVAIAKDKKGDKSTYATYLQLDTAIRPIYVKHGFSVSFNSGESTLPDHVKVLGYLLHDGGHEKTYEADIPCDGKGAKGNDVMTKTHARGSAFTYGKRYLLIMMFNIALKDKADDDGKAAGDQVPDAPISDEQVEELRALMKGADANEERFCKTFGFESLTEIMQSQFETAKKRVMDKVRKAKQGTSE